MEIPFPLSTEPGINPSETGGRLINAYAEKAPEGSRSKVLWRRSPGLDEIGDTVESGPRGAIYVGATLYCVADDKVYSVTKSGSTYTVTALTGTVGGSGPVFMARNMASTAEVLIVHSDGMAEISVSGGSVASFSDADLPSVNSICFIDGYFIVTSAAGRAYASDLNDTAFQAANVATAESSPDGLLRAVPYGGDLYLMGEETIEIWGNAGNPEGFPFSRGPVLPLGLLGAYAVAGFEEGFPHSMVLVGNDRKVYRINGYSPEAISEPWLERLIEAVDDTDDIQASAYVTGGHACIAISGPTWTAVYDMVTGRWHERQSYGSDRWRAVFGVKAFDEWLTFDRDGTTIYRVDDRVKTEGDDPLIWEVWSRQMHTFPHRMVVDRATFDFESAVGDELGQDPIETNPRVSISWSDDGGRTFGTPLLRALGRQGQSIIADIRRCGMTGPRGRVWKLSCSDPVEVVLMGAAMDARQRTAA